MKKLQEIGKIARGVLALFAVIAAVSAYGRTVSVSSVERDSHNRIVRANLQLTTGDAAVLHVAYGAADGGSDIDAWDVHRPVAMVEGTTTSYAYAFPSDMGDDIAAVRFFLLEDYDIPLAKRYAYIQTDGSQYVETSFVPTGRSAVEMQLSLNSVDSSVALCCARTQGNSTDSFTAFYITGSGWRFDYFAAGSAVGPVAVMQCGWKIPGCSLTVRAFPLVHPSLVVFPALRFCFSRLTMETLLMQKIKPVKNYTH